MVTSSMTRVLCATAAAATVTGGGSWAYGSEREQLRPHPKKNAEIAISTSQAEKQRLADAVVRRYMASRGIPGLSVSVSVDGRAAWSAGFGYADIETGAPCTPRSVMRIASISKPITATVAALLVDSGKLDLDKPIQAYLPDFPIKKWNNNPTTITTRHLLSHTSGIRHYEKAGEEKNKHDGDNKQSEFYYNKKFANISDSLKMFEEDELVVETGKYSYTTHGYTLAAAVMKKASGQEFKHLMRDLFARLGMRHTYLDTNSDIVYDRVKYYSRSKNGKLENCPEVDNSYKWAGGGVLSCVGDLLVFGNAILFSQQASAGEAARTLLTRETAADFWKGEVAISKTFHRCVQSALGWMRVDNSAGCKESVISMEAARPLGGFWYHTGGAIGASSALLIVPSTENKRCGNPSGTCVAILVNLQGTCVLELAEELADIFRSE